MKYIIGALSSILTIVLCFSFNTAAHPGNTDSSGGHTCWTNCSYWGYDYGEYHYHNGAYDYTDYYDQGSEAGSDFVSQNSTYIVGRAEAEGYEEGRDDGESGATEIKSPDPDSTCSDVDFEDYSSPQDYYDGFIDSYNDGCRDVYEQKYSLAYTDAYALGYESYETAVALEAEEEQGKVETDAIDWSGILLVSAAIVIPLVAVGNWGNIKKWWLGI